MRLVPNSMVDRPVDESMRAPGRVKFIKVECEILGIQRL